ncbi:hypothetical protein Agabi119p4_6674 [Agaricus bisporus var. burnettii]|uniref:Uncharacterized protein n=1 Tax=Agaricus bisporus var. burnettii TaxID=192524 RepID=A0A8H7C8Z4_AGABI|nr:hypothetical protein Agabi119p4_6674 [Agaricus bisporus var. burnettii]
MNPPTRAPSTRDIQDDAHGPHPLPSADPSSLSGPVDSDDSFSGAVDRFGHLKLTPPVCERTQKLKALPGCEELRGFALESIEEWSKSFELTEQEPSFEDLEPVETLKKSTNNDLLQQQFEALVKFSAGVTSCLKEFQELRKPFDDLESAQNTPVTQQAEAAIQLRDGLRRNAEKLIMNKKIVLDYKGNAWEFRSTSVKEAQDKIESSLFAEHDRQEDIQFTLDLLKDGERITPKVKEPSGLVATSLEGIAKYGILKLAGRHKNKLLESKMSQDAYQAEKSKAEALDQKLVESTDCLDRMNAIWSDFDLAVYSGTLFVINKVSSGNSNTSFVTVAKRLDETEGKLLTLIELIDNFLAQVTKDYGFQFRTREIKRLCHHVPNIFTALEKLLSAKEVVADNHQHVYEGHIYELCKVISEHFEIMKDVYSESRMAVNVERQAAYLIDNVPDIQIGVEPHLEAIKNIAQSHISKAKSKEAGKKRDKEDKYYGNLTLTRPGRPLITGKEILWALHKVVDALSLIQAVSKASDPCDKSTGENVENVEDTAADRTPEWLKMPDEMISQFYEVLFGESKKLQFLKDNRAKSFPAKQTYERLDSNFEEPGEPGGRFSQLRRLMLRKLH